MDELAAAIVRVENWLLANPQTENLTPLSVVDGQIFVDGRRLAKNLDTIPHYAVYVPMLVIRDYDLASLLVAEMDYVLISRSI